MQINEQYLARFAVPASSPAEIPLNGYERPASHVINVDDPDGTYIAATYRDDYPSESPWDAKDGADKRETFVIAKRGADAVGGVGYRFSGLVNLNDLRTWYRTKIGLPEPTPAEPAE